MLSRPGITKGSSAPSGACCPTPRPPPPGCRPGPSRRPRRPSRRFSRAFMSSYSPLTNTSRKIGKVFWIVSVINCRYWRLTQFLKFTVFRGGSDGSPHPKLQAGPDQVPGRGGDGLQGPGRHVQGEPRQQGCDGVISVANMKLLCETTCSLLLFIFRV